MARKSNKKVKSKKTKKKSMARKSSKKRSSGGRKSRSGSFSGIFNRPIVKSSVMGVGAGVVTKLVLDRFAPQFSGIGSVGAGFLAGGPIGGAINLFLSGGLQQLGNIFGGSQSGNGESV